MDVRKKRLRKAAVYAADSNYAIYDHQTNLLDKIRNYANVCIFGIGTFFKEGYPYVKEMLGAAYVCDNHIEQALKEKRETYGLTGITVDELEKLENTLVVIMIGNGYTEVEKQLDEKNIEHVYIGELILNMYTPKHSAEWFLKESENIVNAVDLFEDEESKDNYVEIICNRIAPHLSEKTFEEIKTGGEYFATGLWSYQPEEIFVDVGAYTGDTIIQFRDHVLKNKGGYRKIYAFELEKNFYQQLITNVEKEGLENIDAYNIGIAETCNEQGSMICLDTMFLEKEITLVKMDIEGYEWGRYMAD